ncbi:MAG: hypothetical protein U9O64_09350 [Campylobacterota bacterium]|nr:hypothetical protein [Campylobacterota bacterium]
MKLKTVATIIIYSIISTSMTQANSQNILSTIKASDNGSKATQALYESMSTTQLQIEVEKHSNNKSLSFALGKELIKRWTKS